MKSPARLRHYYFARERETNQNEVPWMRIRDFKNLDLPRPIVVVNGAFDILHSGHMKIIFQARAKAGKNGTLICALDSDARVGRKGSGRPIQTYIERATTMNFMPIDYLVEIEKDVDMKWLFYYIRPDLRVQGYDYERKLSKYPNIPKCFVRGTGMRTSKIIERCKSVSD